MCGGLAGCAAVTVCKFQPLALPFARTLPPSLKLKAELILYVCSKYTGGDEDEITAPGRAAEIRSKCPQSVQECVGRVSEDMEE